MKANKGFIFSTDALLAVAIVALFVASFSFFSASSADGPYLLLLLEKQADDLLIVLDKSGTLETLDANLIAQSMNNTLEKPLAWNIEIDYYNYSTKFESVSNLSFGGDYGNAKRVAVAERDFLVFENATGTDRKPIKYYGKARLKLWAE